MEENTSYEEEILLSVRKVMRAIDMHSSSLARFSTCDKIVMELVVNNGIGRNQ